MKIPVLIDDGFVNFDRERSIDYVRINGRAITRNTSFYFTTEVPLQLPKENVLNLGERERR